MNKSRFLNEILGDSYSTDPDNTKEARVFYATYWQEVLSNQVEEYGETGDYRGETINTFSTLAGALIRVTSSYENAVKNGTKNFMPKSSRERLDLILACEDITDEVKELFTNYYHKYHTLANFMPLPSNRGKKENNINLLKNSKYKDFVDQYLIEVRDYYNGKKVSSDIFDDPKNIKYFDKFGNFENYIEKNYLQDYVSPRNYEDIKLIKPVGQIKYNQKIQISDVQASISEIVKTVETILELIELRAERLEQVIID